MILKLMVACSFIIALVFISSLRFQEVTTVFWVIEFNCKMRRRAWISTSDGFARVVLDVHRARKFSTREDARAEIRRLDLPASWTAVLLRHK